jgi:hypothetical protein
MSMLECWETTNTAPPQYRTLLPPCVVQQASHLSLSPGKTLQQLVTHRLRCSWGRHRLPVVACHALLHQHGQLAAMKLNISGEQQVWQLRMAV